MLPGMHDPGSELSRRTVLRGGLAALAGALSACGPNASPSPATDAGSADDAGDAVDAAMPHDVSAEAEVPRDVVTTDGPAGGDGPFVPRDLPPLPRLRSRLGELGRLGDPDANGVRLPAGFTSRVIARSGMTVAGTGHRWHQLPDGGATYPTREGGWIYVSNSEVPRLPPALKGGVGAVRFAPDGRIERAYRILDDTSINCAGGLTPWHTWLSCEEFSRGQVFECDPWGERAAVVRPALGVFKHEAAAVDPRTGMVYLTEDEPDGRFYRFVPQRLTDRGHPDLRAGTLEVAVRQGDRITWTPVPDPRFTGETPTRAQVPGSAVFNGGEGLWHHDGTMYFTTKGDDRVWAYEIASSRLRVLYDRANFGAMAPLRGVDNVTVACCGDVLVAEDGGSMQVVVVQPSGTVLPLVQVVGHPDSEITGPAFDPSGTRLYFSSQRGPGGGWTFEVTGPFHERLG